MTLRPGPLLSCLLALGMVGLATALRFPVRAQLGACTPFLFYWPAVLLASVCWGRWSGILATASSATLADYFWMAPQGSFGVDSAELLDLMTFAVAGLCLSLLSGKWHQERLAKEHLRASLSNVGSAVITTDAAGRVVFFNGQAQLLTGRGGDEVAGQPIACVLFLQSEDDNELMNHALQQALVNDEPERLPRQLWLLGKDGKRHWVEQRTCRILDGKGQKTGAVLLLHDQGCAS